MRPDTGLYETLLAALSAVDDGFIVTEGERIVYANEAFCRISGYEIEELAGLPSLFELIPAEVKAEAREQFRKRLSGEKMEDRAEAVMLHKGGRRVDLDIGIKQIQDQDRPRLVIVARDITGRKRAEAARRAAEERYRSIFENAVEGMFQTSIEGRLIAVNPAMARIYGYTTPEALISAIPTTEMLYVDPERRSELTRTLRQDGSVSGFEIQVRRKDGTKIWVSTSARALQDITGEVTGFEGALEDVTSRKALEERLEHQAFHDALTGLPNRSLFLDRLRHALARTDRREDYIAVLFLDLDGFKAINDSMGHEAGDMLLREVARRLRASVRIGDTTARFGGDEFTVLLEDVASAEEASAAAERIAEELSAPIMLAGKEVSITASIGISLSASPQDRPEDLLREADAAMYAVKNRGRVSYP